ncbi:MAG: hypothetical protein ACOC4A_02125, partial [Spirochaetota bacterium]
YARAEYRERLHVFGVHGLLEPRHPVGGESRCAISQADWKFSMAWVSIIRADSGPIAWRFGNGIPTLCAHPTIPPFRMSSYSTSPAGRTGSWRCRRRIGFIPATAARTRSRGSIRGQASGWRRRT